MKRALTLFLLLLTAALQAQNILRLQHINVEDGLSQSSVYTIFQDKQGFMWFGTGDGLNRYDGKSFTIYKSKLGDTSSANLRDRNIFSRIFEDNQERLWMSTDAGVWFFDSRQNIFRFILNKYTMAVGLDSSSLWATVNQGGLDEIDIHNFSHRFYKFIDKWQNEKKVSIIYNGVVTPKGVWLADQAGLLFFDKTTRTDKRMFINDKINSVNLLQNGNLLLCSDDGVYLYNPGTNSSEFIPVKCAAANKTITWRSFAEDTSAHLVYIGAFNSGVICKLNLENRRSDFLDFQKSTIYAMLIDHSGNLWIGTEGDGIYKLDIKQPKFSCYAPNLPLGSGDANGLMVKSIYRDDSGQLWIGSFNNGLVKYNMATRQLSKTPLSSGSAGKLISTIRKDSSGAMLITVGPQIIRFDARSNKALNQLTLPIRQSSSPDYPNIFSLVEWRKGHFLAATNIGLYGVKNENSVMSVLSSPFNPDTVVSVWTYCLYQGQNDTVYIGKRDGFMKIRVINDSSYLVLDRGFENLAFRGFYKSTCAPILWMATEEGLIAYNERTKAYKIIDETSGLANSFIYAILPASDTSLWVSTNHGIARVNVHYNNLTDIVTDITNFTSEDGLQSNEFNTGAYFRAGDGTLFFGGISGINWFDPSSIKPNPFKATPVVTGVYINDVLIPKSAPDYLGNLNLPYNNNTISFSLRALEYTQPNRNQFAYKLDGLDKDWVYTSGDKVRYSNLQPGSYTFLLKASNNDGVWNDEPLKIHIGIAPPFWQSWWFYLLVITTCVSLVILAIRLYVKQKVKAKTRELEKQQALYMERLRISKDVHDDLGSGLSKISLMAEIAHKRAEGNIALGNDIRHISSVSKELVDNMRDLIWVLNPENTTLGQLVSRLREYCADYLENMPVRFTLDFPESVPEMRISREAQRNIFLTVKEAINNCIKHSGAGEIKILLRFDAETMYIAVADNGAGFDRNRLKGSGNGLRNMKNRIELIGGTFEIISSPGHTIVTILIDFEKLSDKKIPL